MDDDYFFRDFPLRCPSQSSQKAKEVAQNYSQILFPPRELFSDERLNSPAAVFPPIHVAVAVSFHR